MEVMVPARVPVVVVLDVVDVVLDDVAAWLSVGRMDMGAGVSLNVLLWARCGVLGTAVEIVKVSMSSMSLPGRPVAVGCQCVLQWRAWGRGNQQSPPTVAEIQGRENGF